MGVRPPLPPLYPSVLASVCVRQKSVRASSHQPSRIISRVNSSEEPIEKKALYLRSLVQPSRFWYQTS